jgi:hypothetical protein
VAPHLVVALSSHGFGHIGQTAPVVASLRAAIPGLHVTLRTAAPQFKLVERFGESVSISRTITDVGMIQRDAQTIAPEATAQAYAEFHRDWEGHVAEEARALLDLRADAVLANVPYLALAGAQVARIPAVALCSINWMDIYRHFFGARTEAAVVLEHMFEAYGSARLFLQPAPSMPMEDLANRKAIGPICQRGSSHRSWFEEHVGLRPDEKLVMVSLGGMEVRPPVQQWPVLPGWRLIVPTSWRSTHPKTLDLDSLGLRYIDALWSCDALICKPGYGSFVEAACAGLPVLYVERPGWPEASYGLSWLKRVARCALLTQQQWLEGTFTERLTQVLETPPPPPVVPVGVKEAAEAVLEVLK